MYDCRTMLYVLNSTAIHTIHERKAPMTISTETFAGLLADTHVIHGDRRERLNTLVALRALIKATEEAGWQEHTNDWDWCVYVTMNDGTKYGGDGENGAFVYTSFKLDGSDEDDSTELLGESIEYIRFYGQYNVPSIAAEFEAEPEGAVEYVLPIDSIQTIEIERLG